VSDDVEQTTDQTDERNQDPLHALEGRLGHVFVQRKLLVDALTHRSYAYEYAAPNVVNNERLEFLGDAVLAFVSADLLFTRYPQADEGMLTQYRAALVQAATLARFAEALELGPHLRLGRGEDAIGGRMRAPLLAAAYEAVLGALYVDGGMAVARAFLEQYLLGELGRIEAAGMGPRIKDAKSRLQELAQGALSRTPRYQVVEESGPSHDRTFVVQALIGDVVVGQGTGKNKRQAEQAAAQAALADPGWQQGDRAASSASNASNASSVSNAEPASDLEA
jgi:ribonuclease III